MSDVEYFHIFSIKYETCSCNGPYLPDTGNTTQTDRDKTESNAKMHIRTDLFRIFVE